MHFINLLLVFHHAYFALYISETWGLDQPSIGTEHVYDLFRGIRGLNYINRLKYENSAYIFKIQHVYGLFKGIRGLDDIH